MKISKIPFLGTPTKYDKIDNYVSRSGQPKKDDFEWLKSQGVTDVLSLRKSIIIDGLDEKQIVNSLGMTYHHIPSTSKTPDEKSILKFLNLTQHIREQGRKLHIHCMEGVDRTGLYSFMYKEFNNIGTSKENIVEWIKKGLHLERYPKLISWALNFVKHNKK